MLTPSGILPEADPIQPLPMPASPRKTAAQEAQTSAEEWNGPTRAPNISGGAFPPNLSRLSCRAESKHRVASPPTTDRLSNGWSHWHQAPLARAGGMVESLGHRSWLAWQLTRPGVRISLAACSLPSRRTCPHAGHCHQRASFLLAFLPQRIQSLSLLSLLSFSSSIFRYSHAFLVSCISFILLFQLRYSYAFIAR